MFLQRSACPLDGKALREQVQDLCEFHVVSDGAARNSSPGLVRQNVDASDAADTLRPKRKDMENSHFSGKAGRHTAKTQYTVNMHGLIIHNTRHSPGRVHDFKVYKTKHPTFPKDLPSRDGSAQGRESARTCGLMATVGIRGAQEGGSRRRGSAANQVQAWQKAHPGGEGDQQTAVQDPGPRGECDPPGQNPPDHG